MSRFINSVTAKMVVTGCDVKDRIKKKLYDNSGNWVDEALKYIGSVVIGLLIISAIVAFLNKDVLPELKEKILEGFNIK